MPGAAPQIPDPGPSAARKPACEVEWAVSGRPVEYPAAVACMEARAEAIASGRAGELVWLLEHPAIYTAGTSARPEELLAHDQLPVFQTGRGGRYTYHGPGQRVIYLMLDVKKRGGDVRSFVGTLEDWIIDALAELGVTAERRADRVGVWVNAPDAGGGEAKIAAIGLRLRRWVSLHGISLNVGPDLSHYAGIVPCGITGYGVTSLAALGRPHAMGVVDEILRFTFERRFAPVRRVLAPLEAAPQASMLAAG